MRCARASIRLRQYLFATHRYGFAEEFDKKEALWRGEAPVLLYDSVAAAHDY